MKYKMSKNYFLPFKPLLTSLFQNEQLREFTFPWPNRTC